MCLIMIQNSAIARTVEVCELREGKGQARRGREDEEESGEAHAEYRIGTVPYKGKHLITG